jgi:hypothetical protein
MYDRWSHALAVNHETLASKTFFRFALILRFLAGSSLSIDVVSISEEERRI